MQRIQDRIYMLLVLSGKELFKQFKVGYIHLSIFLIINIFLSLTLSIGKYNILIGLITLFLLVFIHLILLFNHLEVVVNESDNQSDVIEESVFVEEVGDKEFYFEDEVQNIFNEKDGVGMINLLFNKNKKQIKEIIK